MDFSRRIVLKLTYQETASDRRWSLMSTIALFILYYLSRHLGYIIQMSTNNKPSNDEIARHNVIQKKTEVHS